MPLAAFGLGEPRYADCDDGTDFSGQERRYFRNSLKLAARAVEQWNAIGVDAVVQLGDIIDGCNSKLEASEKALRAVLEVLNRSSEKGDEEEKKGKVLERNHELYNLRRAGLERCGLRCGAGGRLGFRW